MEKMRRETAARSSSRNVSPMKPDLAAVFCERMGAGGVLPFVIAMNRALTLRGSELNSTVRMRVRISDIGECPPG
jgi:hypothetical protein